MGQSLLIMELFPECDRKRLKRHNGHGSESAAFRLFQPADELNRPYGNDCSGFIALRKTCEGSEYV